MRQSSVQSGRAERSHAGWRAAGLLAFFSLVALVFSRAVLHHFGYWGIQDWDVFFFYHDAPAIVVRDYHQFPLWNPWFCGGMPMLARPESPFLSPLFLLTLWFGALHGLKVQIVLHLTIGLCGTYALARQLRSSRLAALLAAFVYMLGGTYTQHMTVGNAWAYSMAFIPWAVLFWLKAVGKGGKEDGGVRCQVSGSEQDAHRKPSGLTPESRHLPSEFQTHPSPLVPRPFPSAFACAATLTLMWFSGGPYPMVITLLFFAAHALFGILTHELRAWPVVRALLLIGLLTFGLGAIKFLPSIEFTTQYPRVAEMGTGFSLDSLRFGLIGRDQTLHAAESLRKGSGFLRGMSQGVNETGSYVGLLPMLLFLVGAVSQGMRRRALLLALIFFLWLSFGVRAPFSAWEFLHDLPVFNITRVAERFRLIFLLVIAVGAGWGLDQLRAGVRRVTSWPSAPGLVATLALALVWVDLMLVVSPLLGQAFTIPPFEMPSAPGRAFVQTASHYTIGQHGWATKEDDQALCAWSSHYPALLSNLGVILGNEDMPVPKDATAFDASDYKGEVYVFGTSGEAAYRRWSPNKLVIEARTGGDGWVVVNQNYYPGWHVRGAPGLKVESLDGLMAVRVRAGNHRLTLSYWPASFLIGAFVSLATVIGGMWYLRRLRRPAPAPAWFVAFLARMPRRLPPRVLIALALAAVTLLVYLPTLQSAFINMDDDVYVTENPHVKTGLTLTNIRWALTSTERSNYWHPLTWISHMLDVEIYGLRAGGHHLTNVLLHVANTVVLFFVLHAWCGVRRKTGDSKCGAWDVLWPPTIAAALFALHPLHVESVAWVAERKDVLSTLFWLLTLGAYTRFAQEKNLLWYGLALLCFVFGLMSKPMLVTLPFVLLLLDYWPLQRGRSNIEGPGSVAVGGTTQRSSLQFGSACAKWCALLLEKFPFVLIAVGASIWAFAAQSEGAALRSLAQVPLGSRIANALVSYVVYLGKMMWPHPLTIYYPLFGEAMPIWQPAGAAALLFAITIAVLWQVRRRPYLFVGWFWYVGTLLPVIGLVQIGTFARADRYTYVPLIGIFIMVAWGMGEFWISDCRLRIDGTDIRNPQIANRKSKMGKSVLLPGAVLFVCAVLTWRQLGTWKNSTTLFTHNLRVAGNNAVAQDGLGAAFLDEGAYEEAVPHFQESVRLMPDAARTHFRLGRALAGAERFDEAIAAYEDALAVADDFTEAWINLGVAVMQQGDSARAADCFRQAVKHEPDNAEAHSNLGIVLCASGNLEEGLRSLNAAVRLKPDNAESRNNLGRALVIVGRLSEAQSQLRQAISLKPDYAEAHRNLADVLVRQGKPEEAQAHTRAAAPREVPEE